MEYVRYKEEGNTHEIMMWTKPSNWELKEGERRIEADGENGCEKEDRFSSKNNKLINEYM